MKELMLIAALCVYLDTPSQDEYPSREIEDAAFGLWHEGKRAVAEYAASKLVHFPQAEEPDWATFSGSYNIFWRRAQGRPLPYPVDPLLGSRESP